MKGAAFVAGLVVVFSAGCVSPPPGAEPGGPQNTYAYQVLVDASPPGARIEVNGRIAGPAPITLKFFGDINRKFYDFGFENYVIRALPVATNQFVQTRVFRTGTDLIPPRIDFAMNQPGAAYVPLVPPAPVYLSPNRPPGYPP